MTPGAVQHILQELPPEISRVLRLDEITNVANTIIIDATLPECAGLAERFELPYVRNLSVEITYRRTRSGQMVRIDGRITANYSQLCSATLAPMPMMMEETFQTEYTLVPWEKFSEFDLDQPEVLSDDFVDVGEIAAQYFGLAIDPYARRAGNETLAELADSITEAVAEMVAQTETAIQPLQVEIASTPVANDVAVPELKINGADEAGQKTTAAIEELIVEMEEEPEPVTPPKQQQESLFFRYLREIQQN